MSTAVWTAAFGAFLAVSVIIVLGVWLVHKVETKVEPFEDE